MSTTHFQVLSMGKRRTLFRIRELADGSLTFMFKAAQSSFGHDGIKKVKDQHVTAHSRRIHSGRAGYKVKSSMLTTHGDYYDRSLIVNARGSRFLWPVDSVLEGSLLSPSYDAKVRTGDEIREIIGFLGFDNTLNYTVFASTPTVNMPNVQGFSRFTFPFASLVATVYVTFLHYPNATFVLRSTYASGPLRKNGALVEPGWPPVMSMPPRDVNEHLYRSHTFLAQSYLDVVNAARVEGAPDTLVSLTESSWGRWPSLTDEEHAAFGEGARHKNPVFDDPLDRDGKVKPAWYKPRGVIRTIMKGSDADGE